MSPSARSILAASSLLAVAACGGDVGDPPDADGSSDTAGSGDGSGPTSDGDSTGDTGSDGPPDSTGDTTADTTADTGSSSDDGGSDESSGTGPGPGAEGPDLDADGVADFVMGARAFDGYAGAVWIDYGDDSLWSDGLDTAEVMLTSTALGSNFGEAGSMCDVDDDGVTDLVVGGLDGIGVYWGGETIVEGQDPDLLILAPELVTPNSIHCDDFDGDGVSDIITVGSTFSDWQLTIIGGSAALGDQTDLDYLGWAGVATFTNDDGTFFPPSAVGDVNGDGAADVLVGAPMVLPNGAAFLFLGGGQADMVPASGGLAGQPPASGQMLLDPNVTFTSAFSEYGRSVGISHDAEGEPSNFVIGHLSGAVVFPGSEDVEGLLAMPPGEGTQHAGAVAEHAVSLAGGDARTIGLDASAVYYAYRSAGGDDFLAWVDSVSGQGCAAALASEHGYAAKTVERGDADSIGVTLWGSVDMLGMPDGEGATVELTVGTYGSNGVSESATVTTIDPDALDECDFQIQWTAEDGTSILAIR